MKKVTEIVAELARPVVEEHGCTLWDVEYVREAGQWYLRLLIDKQGGVDILDCEAISRVVSDLLDEADPIEGSYVFEVGSAEAERPLKRPADFEQFMGADVLLKTYKPRDGRKEFSGVLTGYDDGAVSLTVGSETLRFEKPEIALVRLRCDSDHHHFIINNKELISMKCDEIFAALAMLEKERGISQTFMMDKIVQALTTAYKRDHEGVENVIVDVDEAKRDLKMYVQKEVVEEVENPGTQMSLEDAKKLSAK